MRSFRNIALFLTFGVTSGCALFRPAPHKLYQSALKHKPYDAIIVPGVPLRNGTWDSIMKARVLWSVYLYKTGLAHNIIYSGNAVYSPYIEAKVMALYAVALGIPSEHIFLEPLALHSTENIYFSYKVARLQGFKTIALATDPFQASLLYRFTRKRFRTQITPIPVLFDTIKVRNGINPKLDISSAYVENWKSITETQSRHFRHRGTRGKNIPFEKRRMDKL